MAKGFGTKKHSKQVYIKFLYKLINVVGKNKKDLQAAYNLLKANLDKLDDTFASLLSEWQKNKLASAPIYLVRDTAVFILNLSNLFKEFPLGNKKLQLEIAINGYKTALTVLTREKFSKEWAIVQNNLGMAYIDRISGENIINLDIGISYLEKALEVLTKDAYPEDWAMTQIHLGAAYREQIHGDIQAIREKAIQSCQNALTVLTKENNPHYWGLAYNNLGNAYCTRIMRNKNKNLEQAIIYYEQALEVFNKEKFPEDWAMTMNNLSLAYTNIKLNTDDNNSDNIELAIAGYKSALKIYTCEAFPQDWAMLQNNLANAYCVRRQGNSLENINKAIDAYKSALKIYTYKAFPEKWSQLQNDLGTAYIVQGKINLELRIDSENINEKSHINFLNKAINCFQLALKIRTPTANPSECYETACNLGNTTFLAGYLIADYWTESIEGYSAAIEAVETSRSWVKSESRRQEILEESIDIYQNMVESCINAGQIDKAFEYSERSRSKRLVDLMASNNLSQSENIPPKVQELLQQYEELQQLIDAERQKYRSENNRSETRAVWQAYNEKIASLEAEKQQIWEQLRREDPVLAGEIQVNPLSLSEIQQLIDNPNTAILSFYTTNTDTYIFIVRQNHISLHTCTGQGLETFQNWIYQNWLLDYVNDSKKWESQVEIILREISQRLQLSELIDQHLQGIEELIIVPHLLLHQIPFAALPTGEYQEHLVDRFLIRYTPSCQILEFCHQRPNVEIFHETSLLQYGTVEDATDDLYCARWEGEQIAKMYNIQAEKRLIGSSQATRQNYRQLAEQVQILHSCHHAESCLYNPLESQLKLADGNITLGQLMSPGWRLPNLVDVFLSCCETNLGTTPLTDDILTLSTGFLCAGARSVVSSLWIVDDLATSLFSIFYYQQRQQDKNRPESLKHAQIKLRELRKADLAEISNQINEKEKELIGNRQQYNRNSVDYSKWEDQYNTHAKINRLIKQKIQISEPEFPFAHPCYWAAFVCHGLR